MSYDATDEGSDTETETVSEFSEGLLSVILSGSSCNLNDCASSVLTSHHQLIIETIDLQSVVEHVNSQGAISDADNAVLSDESKPVVARKEYFLTRIIKDKGIDGFNLLMGALKNCQHDPKQIALGEKLYAAMQQTFTSSSDSSRAASPLSVREEWMSAYESAMEEQVDRDNTTPTNTANVTDEQTPLISSTDHSSSVKSKKKGRSRKSKNRSSLSTLTSANQVISYGTANTYLKIILMGDVKVGKTSLISRYIKGEFDSHQTPTAGMDTSVRNFTFNSKDYILQLWDTGGALLHQPSLLPVYCRTAVGAVFVYDVQSEYSLYNLGQWRQTLNSLVTRKDKKPIPSILIGNKHDTGHELDGAAVCQQLGIQQWFYVSAKTGENVEAAFECLIKQIIEDDLDSSKVHEQSYQFPEPQDATTKTCCSCAIL